MAKVLLWLGVWVLVLMVGIPVIVYVWDGASMPGEPTPVHNVWNQVFQGISVLFAGSIAVSLIRLNEGLIEIIGLHKKVYDLDDDQTAQQRSKAA